ncbi:hypothetical protein [Bradyrhizobium japonicum]|uniref:hypothetical protein n=1 Tax=Bradyrhizobium japonicum TaxID=375 RepID=UPI0020A10FAE|nr:hypothetical protein [Bradyrhizobium japonicum]MCP1773654.1 chromosome segregation ATPase [Bradyrhizobium japonicum]MCP1963345.1 chromosome segregation ATPase [Bradyrhizobium japonicum]
MTYRRLRSAVATREAIEAIPADAREQRAQHLVARERGQRLAAARAGVTAALEAHERALASVPAAEADLEAARAKLDEVEREVAAVAPAA